MTKKLFDDELRALRRDRAFRTGPELFLHERAFDDVLERISFVRRRFRSALLLGCPDPRWPDRLSSFVDRVEVFEPGPAFAAAASGVCCSETQLPVEPGTFDLCIAVGTLDTVNDLPDALLVVRFALQPDSLFIGALAGGESLPRLRAAMRAADDVAGAASPHVHPRIEPAGLTGLLSSAGFAMPVVDVDRVRVRYRSLGDLVRDLRAMGATNLLHARSRKPLSREAAAAAAASFASDAVDGRVEELFEILHFAAWTPPAVGESRQG